MSLRRICVAVSIFGLWLWGSTVLPQTIDAETASADGPSALTADDILTHVFERAAMQEESRVELAYEYLVASTVESLNGDGDVTDIEMARYRRYPLEGLLYEELIERDGESLDDDDAREQQEKKADFIREARAHAERGEEYEPDEMRILFDHELMDRYQTTLDGTEMIRSYVCWVVSFEPREGKLPDKRQMDKALNRSTGRLWIAQDDYGVARISFEMREPFRYLWGLVASLRHADGQFDFERVEGNLWTPVTFDLHLDLRVFFRNIRRNIRQEWLEIRPLSAD